MLYVSVKDDVTKGLINPPPQKMIANENGTFVKMLQVSDVLTPQYRTCINCSANRRCARVQKEKNGTIKDVECVIEKDILDVVLTRLTFEGVTAQDELLMFPLIRNAFLMVRTYEVETVVDFNRLLRDEDAMKSFKDMMGIVGKAEAQYIKILKELLATRKESGKNKIQNINKKQPYDLAQKLSEKNANQT